MANEEHLALLKQGVEQWNKWRNQDSSIQPDLSYADLSEVNLVFPNLRYADLSDANLRDTNLNAVSRFVVKLNSSMLSNADLSESDLRGVNLSGARLTDARLTDANLIRANLSGADLNGANLIGTDLSYANLHGTDLSFADLSNASLGNTDLRGAIVESTIFDNIDLRSVKGLAELNHRAPSRVELHSIQLPQDGSALHFLRGAGVPDEWIDFYRAAMMHPIQYYSCFISYSSKDETLAHRLHADLQAQGVRCWFAPEDMKIGDKIRSRIDDAIHMQDKLLLLLSEHALASDWVEVEVEAALEKEQRQDREVLFPVRLDESVMQTTQAWAKQLRRGRHIGNFTNWTDPQAYERAFKRLLRDLKAQTSGGKNG